MQSKSSTPLHDHPVYSVVLPVYNEAGNMKDLITGIVAALGPTGHAFEIITVDDTSTDGSLDVLNALAASDARVRVLAHVKNCGQSAALATGLRHARGDIVITLDADGQNDPADIPVLCRALTNDVDAVCGVRQKRRDTWVRRASSRIANGFRNWITGDRLADAGCGFRVIRRDALADLPVFNGLHRFLPTLLRYQGFRVVEVPVNHHPRTWGTSKYGIGNRMFRGIYDCLAMRWWRRRAVPGRRLKP